MAVHDRATFDHRRATDAHWLEMTAYAARIELAREQAGLAATPSYRDELAKHAECLDPGR